jgi:hypothetical protein
MNTRSLVLLLFCTTTAAACESGWDIRGEVVTKAVSDKQRPLHVYLLDAPTIDPAQLPSGNVYRDLAHAEVMPKEQLSFTKSEFGCHEGAVMVLAWAPQHAPLGPQNANAPVPFAPKQGDLLAASTVRHPACGMVTDFEQITLELDDTRMVP